MSKKIEDLMLENIKDSMWECFQKFGQKSNIPQLKEYCYALIQATTQKTAGQRENKQNDFNWKHLDMLLMSIAIESTALVLSGDLDKIEKVKIEVAREIFGEIEKLLECCFSSCYINAAEEQFDFYRADLGFQISELKKKYTEVNQ